MTLHTPHPASANAPANRAAATLARIALVALVALGAACGTAPGATLTHPAEVALIARQTLLWAARVPHAPGTPPPVLGAFSVQFTEDQDDLACGTTCVGTAWRDAPGADWEITVLMVDERGQAPTRDVYRTPLAHELVHVLFDDPRHERAELWGPQGVVQNVYTDLVDFGVR